MKINFTHLFWNFISFKKYNVIAQTERDHENPILNGKTKDNRAKKSKVKSKTKGNDTPTLSRWPGDASNTFQRYTNNNTTETNGKFCKSEEIYF